MSTELQTLDLGNFLPADVLADINEAQKALEDSFTSGAAYLGLKGREFHISQGGTTIDLDDKRIDIVVVHAAPNDHRMYYAGEYQENSKDTPTCWSTDGVAPDANVPASCKQADACKDCPMNQKGSGGRGEAKACSTKRRTIIMRVEDESYTPIIADLNAMTLYQSAEARLGLFNFNEVVRQFGAFRKKNNNLASFCFVLQASFTANSVPVLQFSFKDQTDPQGEQVRIAPKDVIEAAVNLWKDGEAQRLMGLEIARPSDEYAEEGNFTAKPTTADDLAPAQIPETMAEKKQREKVAEPVIDDSDDDLIELDEL